MYFENGFLSFFKSIYHSHVDIILMWSKYVLMIDFLFKVSNSAANINKKLQINRNQMSLTLNYN